MELVKILKEELTPRQYLRGKWVSIKISLMAVLATIVITGYASAIKKTDYEKSLLSLIKSELTFNDPASADLILNKGEIQKLCSEYPEIRPKSVASRIRESQLKTIKYPSDGVYLGNWRGGAVIAQSGRGLKPSDPLGGPNGGNCYACHYITKNEISFVGIGPSLNNYRKKFGFSEQIIKYTWSKIYNAQSYTDCSSMPRFGHSGILNEQQIKDVMAFLFDPLSPVNQ